MTPITKPGGLIKPSVDKSQGPTGLLSFIENREKVFHEIVIMEAAIFNFSGNYGICKIETLSLGPKIPRSLY
jgi:hypothetical protein